MQCNAEARRLFGSLNHRSLCMRGNEPECQLWLGSLGLSGHRSDLINCHWGNQDTAVSLLEFGCDPRDRPLAGRSACKSGSSTTIGGVPSRGPFYYFTIFLIRNPCTPHIAGLLDLYKNPTSIPPISRQCVKSCCREIDGDRGELEEIFDDRFGVTARGQFSMKRRRICIWVITPATPLCPLAPSLSCLPKSKKRQEAAILQPTATHSAGPTLLIKFGWE